MENVNGDSAYAQHTDLTPEQQKLREKINDNPANFDAWTAYVASIERENNYEKLARAYDEFLTEYPLLYVYWKKYAELENRQHGEQKAKEVYERGVSCVSKSVDLWTYYCLFVAEKSQDLDEIRRLFERAVDVVGSDYLARILWDAYIQFELSQEEYNRVSQLYTRVLHIPLKDLDRYWDRFKAYAIVRPISDLASDEELRTLDEQRTDQNAEVDDTQKSPEDRKRQKIIAMREQIYHKTQEELRKIQPYESQILRPYFHIQAMDEDQLNTWRLYLDYQEKEGDYKRTVYLYEKCLVPCCFYFEFWLRYVHFLESHNKLDEVREVLTKASQMYLKRRPASHIALAEFEEQSGNIDKARDIFQRLMREVAPGHLESILRTISFERRQNNVQEAATLFTNARDKFSKDEKVFPYFVMEHANFVLKALNNPDEARKVYTSVLLSDNQEIAGRRNKNLWTAYINFEFAQFASTKDHDRINNVFEKVISNEDIAAEDKVDLLTRCFEFALANSPTISNIRRLQYQTIIAQQEAKAATSAPPALAAAGIAPLTPSGAHKRAAEDGLAEQRTPKTARTGAASPAPPATASSPAAAAAAGMDKTAQQQWYAQYGQYPGAAAAGYGAIAGTAAAPAAGYGQYAPQYAQYYAQNPQYAQQYQQYYQGQQPPQQ